MKKYVIKNIVLASFCLLLVIIFCFSFFCDISDFSFYDKVTADELRLDDQEATILAIKRIIPSVVSIIVYDQEDMLVFDVGSGETTIQKEKKQKGRGTGFIISEDGYIITNKHVVEAAKEKTGEYRVILNSGKQYYAQLIGKDPARDLAVLKIFDKNLPYVELGNSDNLQIGTTVIAIGNSLGQYQNSATKGIVSGLGRNIVASDQIGNTATLDNVIQTDAEINHGNSGGPLINLEGQIVGVNVAVDEAGSAIGFAIPINDARPVINSIKEQGRIIRPYLGVRYIMLTPQIAEDNKLPRNSGAWVISGDDGSPAIMSSSPAADAGLEEGDIIFEINAIKVEDHNTLFSVVQKYKPGEKIGLKIQRGDKILIKTVVLEELK